MSGGLVVVGASLAGLRTVETARRRGYDGPVTLVGAEEHPPYDRPPLSKALLEAGAPPRLPALAADLDGLGVELRLGRPATALHPADRTVVVGEESLPYDRLVIATGSAPIVPSGLEPGAGVHCLRTWSDAVAVRAALDGGARTVVVGAGFIGAEVASAARRRDLPVTLVEAAPVPLTRAVGTEVGAWCGELHARHGAVLRCGVSVVGVARGDDGAVRAVRLSDGSSVPADLVVVGVGTRPSTAWLAGSGVDLHPIDGGVLCDALLCTSVPDVLAAGDVAHWPHPLFDDRLMRLEHWTNAAEQGAAAALAAIDPDQAGPLASVPYFWSDWYGHRLQLVGIAAEPVVIDRERLLVLFRQGDRLVGTFAIDRPGQIMKFRRLVAAGAPWVEGLALADRLLAA